MPRLGLRPSFNLSCHLHSHHNVLCFKTSHQVTSRQLTPSSPPTQNSTHAPTASSQLCRRLCHRKTGRREAGNQQRTLAELVSFFVRLFPPSTFLSAPSSQELEGVVLTVIKRLWVNSLLPSPLLTSPGGELSPVVGEFSRTHWTVNVKTKQNKNQK